MNWYKKAQNNANFATWLADELARITTNFKSFPGSNLATTPEVLQQNIEDVQIWANETNPDLSNYNLYKAVEQARIYRTKKRYMSESEKMEANRKGFLAEHQNINPQSPNFAVDMSAKPKAIPPTIKNRINKAIHKAIHKATSNKWFDSVPLNEIMEACEINNVVMLQEDGCKWSGILLGGAECGSEEARKQNVTFQVAFKLEDGYYNITKNGVVLSWCAMGSGKLEIVCYIG